MCVEQETDHVGWTVPASCSGTKVSSLCTVESCMQLEGIVIAAKLMA